MKVKIIPIVNQNLAPKNKNYRFFLKKIMKVKAKNVVATVSLKQSQIHKILSQVQARWILTKLNNNSKEWLIKLIKAHPIRLKLQIL